jgi:hypothetical protein
VDRADARRGEPQHDPDSQRAAAVHHHRARGASAFPPLHVGRVDQQTARHQLGEQQLRGAAIGPPFDGPVDELGRGHGRAELVEHLGEGRREVLDRHGGGGIETEHPGSGSQREQRAVRRQLERRRQCVCGHGPILRARTRQGGRLSTGVWTTGVAVVP